MIGFWRRTHVPARLASGSHLGHSGKHILAASLSQADPKRSWTIVDPKVFFGWIPLNERRPKHSLPISARRGGWFYRADFRLRNS